MYNFLNDYSEGAHPRILKALSDTNLEQTAGYGLDPFCEKAAERIRNLCGRSDLDVHFLVGGTQANLLVIHSLLRSFEAVIAADTGHVNVHETGAIEATGHKVCTVPTPDGKLTPALVEQVVHAHASEHMVAPRLVYVSDTTEIGTFYTKAELCALRRCCQELGLYLYLDGARLGCGLTARGSDLTFADLAALCDVFYIGGTKNGALFGEAVVLCCDAAKPDFRWYMKQRGAMLAKGRLLGLQFYELLRDDLYLDLARHANEMACLLADGLSAHSVLFSVPPQTNQLFPILPNEIIAALQTQCAFDVNQAADASHTAVRLVTSWATPRSAITDFLHAFDQASHIGL